MCQLLQQIFAAEDRVLEVTVHFTMYTRYLDDSYVISLHYLAPVYLSQHYKRVRAHTSREADRLKSRCLSAVIAKCQICWRFVNNS